MKAFVVLVLIAVIAFGYVASKPPAKQPPDWINSLGLYLQPKFNSRDILPACFETETRSFLVVQQCVTRISASQERYRMLALELRQGAQAEISFTPAAGDSSGLPFHKLALKTPGAKTTLVLPPAGGALTILCPLPVPCLLGVR